METIWAIVAIILIDLALSGDNAAVIGLAIKNLSPEHRKKAAFIGAGGAILLRVIFTAMATLLLRVNYLSAIGGVILIWITWKLIAKCDKECEVKTCDNFWPAVGTIIVADLSMAFDNVMAVAGAAHGSIVLVIFGLALSIPILVVGSNWLANLMDRYPLVIYLGGAVLAHTSFAMIFQDAGLNLSRYTGELAAELIPWAIALVLLLWGWQKIRQKKLERKSDEMEEGVEEDLQVFGESLAKPVHMLEDQQECQVKKTR